jgi:hypothetical protein
MLDRGWECVDGQNIPEMPDCIMSNSVLCDFSYKLA